MQTAAWGPHSRGAPNQPQKKKIVVFFKYTNGDEARRLEESKRENKIKGSEIMLPKRLK